MPKPFTGSPRENELLSREHPWREPNARIAHGNRFGRWHRTFQNNLGLLIENAGVTSLITEINAKPSDWSLFHRRAVLRERVILLFFFKASLLLHL
jgi:hypothetical protein